MHFTCLVKVFPFYSLLQLPTYPPIFTIPYLISYSSFSFSNYILNNSFVFLFFQLHTQQLLVFSFLQLYTQQSVCLPFAITKSTTRLFFYFSNHILNNPFVFLSFFFFDYIVNNLSFYFSDYILNNLLFLLIFQSHMLQSTIIFLFQLQSQQSICISTFPIIYSTTHLFFCLSTSSII